MSLAIFYASIHLSCCYNFCFIVLYVLRSILCPVLFLLIYTTVLAFAYSLRTSAVWWKPSCSKQKSYRTDILMQKQKQGEGSAPTIRKPVLARGGGQHYASPALPPRQTGYPLYRSLVASRGPLCTARKPH